MCATWDDFQVNKGIREGVKCWGYLEMKRFGRRVEIRYYLVVKRGNEEQLIAMAYQKVKKDNVKGLKICFT